jgi:hypothetical protein
MVSPLAKRLPACASDARTCAVQRLCFCGDPRSEAAREPLIAPHSRLQRPQTLMNNPTHPPPEKKIAQEQRRRRKRARRGLAHQIRTCTSSQRRGPAPRKRLDAGARTCRSSTGTVNSSYKTAAAFPWLVRAAPICAPRFSLRLLLLHALKARSLRLGCRFARFRRTQRRLLASALRAARPNRTTARRGLLRDAAAGHARGGAGTVLRLSGTAIRDGSQVRLPGTAPGYGSQVRLQGTALRYGSQVRLSGTAAD